ncbi:flagellar hook assembly protein FlgD [Devosia nitrariae]|uniref:Basal-body rod modification protein FlgD n=1 Tax=Devosia nitrariae TaxID=2071872 RepID=A0ABQ5W794_9HYPH|nr:flagellar hook assembly protein FlgD [Devosia nitrariae]GLQ55842.1 flagellar hook assembly protein [Devosia nitrariae]
MTVSGVSDTSSAISSSRSTIADNFDTFLQILTTQLKHQNPLDPMDTNQFTQQLVQFTSVEQQLKTNEFLEALMLSNKAAVNTDAVSYIGKEVTAAGNKADLSNGLAVWGFTAEATAADATVTIKDAHGNVVYTETGSLAKGEGQFIWDGRGSDNNIKPDGTYTISITAKNLSGNYVNVTTATTGIVSAVDFSGDVPVLTIGTSRIALTDVTNVRIPEDDAAEEA